MFNTTIYFYFFAIFFWHLEFPISYKTFGTTMYLIPIPTSMHTFLYYLFNLLLLLFLSRSKLQSKETTTTKAIGQMCAIYAY